MGDSERTAISNLLLEQRDDGTVATQHITEAGCDKLGDALYLAFGNGFIELLTVNLTDALAAAHHIGGIDCLVG